MIRDSNSGTGAAPGSRGALAVASRARALEAVARTRAVGPHFFGNFVGITGFPGAGGHARLLLDVEPGTNPRARISPTAIATVADLSMSAAIRAQLGPQRRLGTITMAVHYLDEVVIGPLRTHAVAPWVDVKEERGFARCDVHDPRGTLVASAEGWFVAMPTPSGRPLPPVPWELPGEVTIPPVSAGALTGDERAAVEACEAAGWRAGGSGTSVVEELLTGTWTPVGDDAIRGELPVGPAYANRGGHVQGGVLFGAAALGAHRVLAEGMTLVDGNLQFVAPAEGDSLVVQARALRHGRRTSFAEARLTIEDRLVAAGTFTFHRLRHELPG